MIIRNPAPQPLPNAQTYQGTISLRCPGCRQIGTFNGLNNVSDITHQLPNIDANGVRRGSEIWFSIQRFCPNQACRTHVFAVVKQDGTLVTSYPPIRLDFDSSSIPPSITKAFEEALTCHASNCYVASAIMVRKTLEELCDDQKATGKTLQERIKALGSKVTLPKELLEGIDHLRLLGNDAAHLESKHYNNIGQAELEAAIKVTKEVLKAVYQYSDLIAELKALQKAGPATP